MTMAIMCRMRLLAAHRRERDKPAVPEIPKLR